MPTKQFKSNWTFTNLYATLEVYVEISYNQGKSECWEMAQN